MAREVTLVDAGLGNIASVERALIQVGAAVRVTGDPDLVARARVVVFPGQGAFGDATQEIVDGAMGAALRMVIERGDPFLGICLGMQLLFDRSDEAAGKQGLSVFPGRCLRFPDGMTIEAESGAEQAPEPEPAEPRAVLEQAQSMERAAASREEEARLSSLASTAATLVGAHSLSGNPDPNALRHAMADESSGTSAETSAAARTAAEGSAALDVALSQIESPSVVQAPLITPAVIQAPIVQGAVSSDAPTPRARPDTPLVRYLKVPHMGWNEVEPTGEHYYFVHSYYAEPERSEDVMWMATYGGIRFPAAVRRQNVLGCQFHPEKSQRAGLKFLRAFLLGGWG